MANYYLSSLLIRLVLLFTGLALPISGFAAGETWECRDSRYVEPRTGGNPILGGSGRSVTPQYEDILVVASGNTEKQDFGKIRVLSQQEQTTSFEIDGFARVWTWLSYGRKPASLYKFVILPSGEGRYYDFKGKAEVSPSMFFKCSIT